MRTITNCRSCESADLTDVIDLGEQYTSDFRADDSKTPKYPVEAVICGACKLVQLRHTTPSGDMYHENYGFKSGVSDSIRNDLKEIVERGLEYAPKRWLDIASNDGTLLSFVPKDVYRVGVDPIGFLCEEARQHADKILNEFFQPKGHLEVGYDVITSISCFYDMDAPNTFVADVSQVLAEDGVWIIQQNYLLTTMELGAVDNFCHEHLEYYTLLSLEPLLERHGFEVFRVETNMVNGGSIRTYVGHRGHHKVQDSVHQQRTIEADTKLDEVDTYEEFAAKAKAQLDALSNLVADLHAKGNKIAILAASTRGSSIWQAAGIGKYVEYAIERNPAKVGKYFSAIGIPIVSEDYARGNKPDYMIVGPWFFAFPEIVRREKDYLDRGGALIIPLPEVEVIRLENYRETAQKSV